MKKEVENKDQEIKVPEGEQLWVSYMNTKGRIAYFLTGTPFRDKYTLYFVQENGRIKKLGECVSPAKLEERFRVLEEIRKIK